MSVWQLIASDRLSLPSDNELMLGMVLPTAL